MSDDEKLKEQNKVLFEYLKTHNLDDNEIRELRCTMDIFFLKVLSSSVVYDKVMQEVCDHLRNV